MSVVVFERSVVDGTEEPKDGRTAETEQVIVQTHSVFEKDEDVV